MTDLDSPNLEGLDRWAVDPRRVEKPWGWELIWADTELYVGKILWIRAGFSPSASGPPPPRWPPSTGSRSRPRPTGPPLKDFWR